ncbi:hypothetical protein PT974_02274 [Cladobotryum mycophilum]|uniref:Amidoligase enzyme n=1 Tax=Cladobotryum mycophilum TaxID=491253 RepID=A0ABR0SXR0_9HYPO
MPNTFTRAPRVTERDLVMQSAQFEADDLPSEITFGVELEFLAPPTVPSRTHVQAGLQAAYLFETEDSDCDDNQLRKAAPKGSIVKTCISQDMRIMSSSSHKNTGENPLFRYWLLKVESDIMGFGRYEEWQPTELNTPILGESESNTGFPDLNKALYTLWNAHPERLHVNNTCGIHVHVAPVGGLTPLHVKRIATLAFLLEDHLLFHLCDPHRRTVHGMLSRASPLSCPPPDTSPLRRHDLDAMSILTYRDSQITNAKSTALNINMHSHTDRHKTYTVEFRHAEASLDRNFVDNWVGLVLTLCKVAFLPTRTYKAAVSQICDIVLPGPPPEHVWRKLLRVINDASPGDWVYVSNEEYWKNRLASQKRR